MELALEVVEEDGEEVGEGRGGEGSGGGGDGGEKVKVKEEGRAEKGSEGERGYIWHVCDRQHIISLYQH